MTPEQRKAILIEWGLRTPNEKKEIMNEYIARCKGFHSQEEWHNFLADRLEIRVHWKRVGLA